MKIPLSALPVSVRNDVRIPNEIDKIHIESIDGKTSYALTVKRGTHRPFLGLAGLKK